MTPIEIGLDTFGDVTVDQNGQLLTPADALRHVIEEGALADHVGLDFFCVGEHHRKTSRYQLPKSSSPRSPRSQTAYISARPSPC